ncbi:hypothetical protein [Streptomyces sp. NPDC048155]|uniref:hypothetical protein n=1 Tax=Streptomyces sp. NPDC048155 TaxID=3154818 RepID=UPI0033DC69FF
MTSVNTQGRGYRYVGPADLKALIQPGGEGRGMRSSADFNEWASKRAIEELAEPFTFVVDAAGGLAAGAAPE